MLLLWLFLSGDTGALSCEHSSVFLDIEHVVISLLLAVGAGCSSKINAARKERNKKVEKKDRSNNIDRKMVSVVVSLRHGVRP